MVTSTRMKNAIPDINATNRDQGINDQIMVVCRLFFSSVS
jgi:hypothetical protein